MTHKTRSTTKRGKGKAKRMYTVAVRWEAAKTYEIEAESPEAAQKIVEGMVNSGDVCIWTDGFVATDNVSVTASCRGTRNF